MSAESRTPGALTAAQMERYQAHLALPGFGTTGQSRLLRARALVIGVGGLGCPAARYLVAAGLSVVGLVDDDVVDATNLQRQILYSAADIGRSKVEAAAERLAAYAGNTDAARVAGYTGSPGRDNEQQVTMHRVRVNAANVAGLVAGYDVVLDGSDNFATRYVVNDACVLAGVPLVTGSLHQFEGQVTVIAPPRTPCYRCLFAAPPREQAACQEAGVLGPLAGIVGTVMAAEALKLVAQGETALMSRLLLVDARDMVFRAIELRRDASCQLCGDSPTIRSPTAVAAPARPAAPATTTECRGSARAHESVPSVGSASAADS